MSLSFAPLLLEGEFAPAIARQALRAAREASPQERVPHLMNAARILHRELALPCDDARELVGLPSLSAVSAPGDDCSPTLDS